MEQNNTVEEKTKEIFELLKGMTYQEATTLLNHCINQLQVECIVKLPS